MKKRFVFRLNGAVYNEIAHSVTSDAEILFSGNPKDNIPADAQAAIDDYKAVKEANALAIKSKKDSINAIKTKLGSKTATLDEIQEALEYLL